MSEQTLEVEQFQGQVDANTPLFNRPPGWLKTLQNMRVKPGGWLEARGGYETLKPSGGTGASVGAGGQFGGFHEHVRQQGAVFMADDKTSGANFSGDIGMLYYFPLLVDGAVTTLNSPTPSVGVGNLDDCIYFGSLEKFSYLRFNLGRSTGPASTYTTEWEYWNGAAWVAVTYVGPIQMFKSAGVQLATWVPQANWTATVVNNNFMYWVRVRIATAGAAAVLGDNSTCQEKIRSNWVGRRLYAAGMVGVGLGAGQPNEIFTSGQTTGGATIWSHLGYATVTNLDSTRIRMATYQDRLIYTDGSVCVKKNLNQYTGAPDIPLGFAKPDLVGGVVNVAAGAGAPNYGANPSNFAFGISYGWGPNGEWGESEIVKSAPTPFAAGQRATITWAYNSGPPESGMVDCIYVYRTNDLVGVTASARSDQPMFRIATIVRDATFPGGSALVPIQVSGGPAATYVDGTYAIPFPAKSAIQAPNLPPARFKLLAVLKNFLFVGGSDEFPARVYWSDGSYGEAFDLDITTSNRFADFAWAGPEVVAMAPAFDAMYCWTEDRMFGVANPEEDFPDIFEVESGRGCSAPDSVCTAFGYLIWQSKDGFYAMDQNRVVQRITNDHAAIFGSMPRLTHGGSRAIIQNGLYEVQLANPSGTPVTGGRWRFDLVKPSWSQSTLALAPLAFVQAPLSHADAGGLHPIYGNINPALSDRAAYVGEFTTVDAGSSYDCIADIHFGPGKFQKFSPRRFAAYYQADSGWGTPVISVPGVNYIFKTLTGFGTVTPKSGTDYKLAIANCTERNTGSQDIVVRFKASSVNGGAVRGQRLIAAYLHGRMGPIHPTS